MHRIIVSGAGQLGSRHLQGLAKATLPYEITVIDPSSVSLSTAKVRFDEAYASGSLKEARYFTNIREAGLEEADLAIIATNADIRPVVIEELLSAIKIKYLILEKVVFQSVTVFEQAIKTIKDKNAKAWVNCPRRVWPFYRDMCSELKDAENFRMEVKGSDWGMACNSIHFVDLFAFLTGDALVSVSGHEFDRKMKESKRAGFFEVTGTIELRNSKGTCTMSSFEEAGAPLQITIETAEKTFIITEQKGECIIYGKETSNPETIRIPVPYQSSLTGDVASAILTEGRCGLTTLEESYLHHKALLPILCAHFSRITGREIINCPIT
ncbi:MAG TPA: NAD-binding protein [Bacteroidales bacterium]|nr:NAD-binding protein [Bacteroidales bacterium]